MTYLMSDISQISINFSFLWRDTLLLNLILLIYLKRCSFLFKWDQSMVINNSGITSFSIQKCILIVNFWDILIIFRVLSIKHINQRCYDKVKTIVAIKPFKRIDNIIKKQNREISMVRISVVQKIAVFRKQRHRKQPSEINALKLKAKPKLRST